MGMLVVWKLMALSGQLGHIMALEIKGLVTERLIYERVGFYSSQAHMGH